MGTWRAGWSTALELSSYFIATMFLVEGLDYLLPVRLDAWGIQPRTWRGLIGVVLSPLLHLNAAHLLANAFPLFVLLVLLFADHQYHPGRTVAIIWIGSGLGTWLIGRGGSTHIGASSLIYGLVVYLIIASLIVRSWRAAAVSLGILIFYGGILYGVLPRKGPVSWEGHLAGAVAGWWAALRSHHH